jgi:ferredoxin-fold anticodon binding domain-containing protein
MIAGNGVYDKDQSGISNKSGDYLLKNKSAGMNTLKFRLEKVRTSATEILIQWNRAVRDKAGPALACR